MVVVNLVYGLTLPLLSLVLDAQGIGKTIIGLSIVAQACAGVVIAPFVPRLIIRIGAAHVMQVSTVLAAAVLVALGLFQDVYLWFPLRFLLGAAAAILWSASETLINELADDSWRGRIIGVYGSTGTDGLLPFVVTAGLILLASVPLFSIRDASRTDEDDAHTGLMRIFRLVPHIMLLNLTYAAAIEAFIAFFPLFGIHIGLGEARSLSLLTTFALGGVILQLPLGWLADHVRRHSLLLACLLLTMVGFAVLPTMIANPVVGPLFAFGLGGVEGMIYALGVILLGQQFRGAELAAASVLYTGMWAAGTMIGPLAVGIGMDILGNGSMAWLIAAIYLCYLPVFLLRTRVSKASIL